MSRIAVTLGAFLCLAGAPAFAEPTPVTIRAISKDAKFIGDSMGGVRVVLTDAATGKELARGMITGATGDTQKIVVAPRGRPSAISTPEAAALHLSLDLDRPTLVKAEAVGPLGKPDAQITVTSMMWLLPGKPISGDGWMLEFPGLVVEPSWRAVPAGFEVAAKVTLMCGCPIEPGGHWDAAKYEVRATLYDADKPLGSTTLAYAGKPSSFAGVIPDAKPGAYRLLVTAMNSETGNVGVVERQATVTP